MIEELDAYALHNLEPKGAVNNNEQSLSNYDPFSRPIIDDYCSEREAKVYLTRQDVIDLGFLRTDPARPIYRHKDKPKLTLIRDIIKDYSVKDEAVEVVRVVIWNMPESFNKLLYNSQRPNKEDIQQVINNYAA